jgi:hypothetical protein
MLPFPLMLIATVDPEICPVPVPLTVALPRQMALNTPDTSESVWLVMVQTKFVQLEPVPVVVDGVTDCTDCTDDQVPINDGTGADACEVGSTGFVIEGTVPFFWKSQPASSTAATTGARARRRIAIEKIL